MSKENPTVIDLADAFRAAVEAIGYVGSVTVHEGGSASHFWVGKPGGNDKEIVITITDYPDQPDVRTFDDGIDRKLPR